jgi:hypothetical protein
VRRRDSTVPFPLPARAYLVPAHSAPSLEAPGLPREWTPVLERNEEAIRPEPLPGYVWLEAAPPPQNRRFHAWADHLEFETEPEELAA